MSVDIFMDLKGIAGESMDRSYAGKIDVLAWSWGMSNSGTTHTGSGGGSGKVNVQDLSFTKYVDKASPNLMDACCSGKHIDEGTLIVRKAGGESPVEYLKIKMARVLISSVSTGGSGEADRLKENVTLNFARVQLDYQEQDDKGGKKGGPVSMTWDIAANTR